MTRAHRNKPIPTSCDTFVAVGLPINCHHQSANDTSSPQTATVFGKNSDRPNDEKHEVVYFPGKSYEEKALVKCQYINIPQARKTYNVVLSRPAWLWGCEMGANEWGLCGGNEAVWTREDNECDDGVERLIGKVFIVWHRK
jgi:secernin